MGTTAATGDGGKVINCATFDILAETFLADLNAWLAAPTVDAPIGIDYLGWVLENTATTLATKKQRTAK